jgi:hypothetical protein
MILNKQILGVVAILAFCILSCACYATEPVAVPTFHCVGLYWSPEEGAESVVCDVKYRSANSGEWKEAIPLWFDARGPEEHSQMLPDRRGRETKSQYEYARQYRGSIVNLTPGTEYEIELSLRNTQTRAMIRVNTWSEDFPIGKTILLPETSNETLVIEESGSPDGYILYTAAPGSSATIDGENKINHCVEIKASYVIIRGLKIKGPKSHAIRIDTGHDIVIEECDISGWGLPGVDEKTQFGKDMEAAIFASEADPQSPVIKRVIIQRCRIHHPRYDTNSWSEYRVEVDPERKKRNWHPLGAQGVTMYNTGGNHVIRYNEIWSDADHYYNDVLGGGNNFSGAGFPNRDSDIYGNRLMNCWDDGIEAEGANCNVRIWGNYIDQTFVKIATAATHVGPLYIWRNVAAQSRSKPADTTDAAGRGPFLKAGSNDKFGGGRTYIFHNTLLQAPPSPGMKVSLGVNIGLSEYGGPMLNHVSRNNILHVTERGSSISNKKVPASQQTNDFDYDLFNGRIQTYEGSEPHGIRGVPIYDPNNGADEFYLAPNSPGYDAGVRIPNFNDDFTGKAPDMGAYEGRNRE